MKKSQTFWLIPFLLLLLNLAAFPAHAQTAPTSKVDECDFNDANSLQHGLYMGTRAYTEGAMTNARVTFESQPRSDIRNSYCLGNVLNFFDAVRALLDGLNLLGAAITNLINSLLNFACQAALTLVNNALSLLCIPYPDLNFGLGLPGGPGRTSCSGAPLASIPGGSPLYLPQTPPAYFNNMSRGIPGAGGQYRF